MIKLLSTYALVSAVLWDILTYLKSVDFYDQNGPLFDSVWPEFQPWDSEEYSVTTVFPAGSSLWFEFSRFTNAQMVIVYQYSRYAARVNSGEWVTVFPNRRTAVGDIGLLGLGSNTLEIAVTNYLSTVKTYTFLLQVDAGLPLTFSLRTSADSLSCSELTSSDYLCDPEVPNSAQSLLTDLSSDPGCSIEVRHVSLISRREQWAPVSGEFPAFFTGAGTHFLEVRVWSAVRVHSQRYRFSINKTPQWTSRIRNLAFRSIQSTSYEYSNYLLITPRPHPEVTDYTLVAHATYEVSRFIEVGVDTWDEARMRVITPFGDSEESFPGVIEAEINLGKNEFVFQPIAPDQGTNITFSMQTASPSSRIKRLRMFLNPLIDMNNQRNYSSNSSVLPLGFAYSYSAEHLRTYRDIREVEPPLWFAELSGDEMNGVQEHHIPPLQYSDFLVNCGFLMLVEPESDEASSYILWAFNPRENTYFASNKTLGLIKIGMNSACVRIYSEDGYSTDAWIMRVYVQNNDTELTELNISAPGGTLSQTSPSEYYLDIGEEASIMSLSVTARDVNASIAVVTELEYSGGNSTASVGGSVALLSDPLANMTVLLVVSAESRNITRAVTITIRRIDVCGNGLRWNETEECDTGTAQYIGSGCYQCRVEPGWTCTGGSSTASDVCTEIPVPSGNGTGNSTDNSPTDTNSTDLPPPGNSTDPTLTDTNSTGPLPLPENSTNPLPPGNNTDPLPPANNSTEQPPANNSTGPSPANNSTEPLPANNSTEPPLPPDNSTTPLSENRTETDPLPGDGNATEPLSDGNSTDPVPGNSTDPQQPPDNSTDPQPANNTDPPPHNNTDPQPLPGNSTDPLPQNDTDTGPPSDNSTDSIDPPLTNHTETSGNGTIPPIGNRTDTPLPEGSGTNGTDSTNSKPGSYTTPSNETVAIPAGGTDTAESSANSEQSGNSQPNSTDTSPSPVTNSTDIPSANSTLPACGDSLLSTPEECDDGNTAPSDGCSALCTVEEGWECEQSLARASVCARMESTAQQLTLSQRFLLLNLSLLVVVTMSVVAFATTLWLKLRGFESAHSAAVTIIPLVMQYQALSLVENVKFDLLTECFRGLQWSLFPTHTDEYLFAHSRRLSPLTSPDFLSATVLSWVSLGILISLHITLLGLSRLRQRYTLQVGLELLTFSAYIYWLLAAYCSIASAWADHTLSFPQPTTLRSGVSLILYFLASALVLGSPVAIPLFIHRNRSRLLTPDFRSRYSGLYEGVEIHCYAAVAVQQVPKPTEMETIGKTVPVTPLTAATARAFHALRPRTIIANEDCEDEAKHRTMVVQSTDIEVPKPAFYSTPMDDHKRKTLSITAEVQAFSDDTEEVVPKPSATAYFFLSIQLIQSLTIIVCLRSGQQLYGFLIGIGSNAAMAGWILAKKPLTSRLHTVLYLLRCVFLVLVWSSLTCSVLLESLQPTARQLALVGVIGLTASFFLIFAVEELSLIRKSRPGGKVVPSTQVEIPKLELEKCQKNGHQDVTTTDRQTAGGLTDRPDLSSLR